MSLSNEIGQRRIVQYTLAYAAGAWAIVQVIEFLVSAYDLSRAFLDIAIYLSVIGGLFTVVIAWFHGTQGPQKRSPQEIPILLALSAIAIIGIFVLRPESPRHEFDQLSGTRLVVMIPRVPPDRQLVNKVDIKDLEDTIVWTENDPEGPGAMNFSPTAVRVAVPGVQILTSEHPVMYERAHETEYHRFTIVFPYYPDELRFLVEEGMRHASATIETEGFSLRSEHPVVLTQREGAVEIEIERPRRWTAGPRNMDFERDLVGWTRYNFTMHELYFSTTDCRSSGGCAKLVSRATDGHAALLQMFESSEFVGRIRVSAWLHMNDEVAENVGLFAWPATDAADPIRTARTEGKTNAIKQGDDSSWQELSVEIGVETVDEVILIGALMFGVGTLIIDDFSIERIEE